MKKAAIFFQAIRAGTLEQRDDGSCRFSYEPSYEGQPISLTMPTAQAHYDFDAFPPFFEGLLPEGIQLEALLKQRKIDRNDPFSQLVAVGADLVGAVTVEEIA